MEPNQSANSTRSMASTPVVVPSVPAESSRSSNDVVFQDQPKKNMGMILTIVLLVLLAAGGIGFGVWAMMDGNAQVAKKDEQIADLNRQLAEKSQTVVGDDTTAVDVETSYNNETDVNTADYIYVGEWGLKIKIPDNLTITGYVYSMLPGYTSVKITGNTKGGQYLPGFADMSMQSPWLGIISRYPKGTEMSPMSPPSFVFADEQYDYYYSHPQMVVSMDEDERNWEIESTNAFEQMLTNKDNYSAI